MLATRQAAFGAADALLRAVCRKLLFASVWMVLWVCGCAVVRPVVLTGDWWRWWEQLVPKERPRVCVYVVARSVLMSKVGEHMCSLICVQSK